METRSGKSLPPRTPPRNKYQTSSQAKIRNSLSISQKYALPASSHQKAHVIADKLYGDQVDLEKTAGEEDHVNQAGIKSAIENYIEQERHKTDDRVTSELKHIPSNVGGEGPEPRCSACSSDLTSEAYSIKCNSRSCKHVFHPSCLGEAGPKDDNPWYCTLCNIQQAKESASKRENDICICQKQVIEENSIFCDSCHRWYHPACINISEKAFTKLTTSKEEYCCPSCTEARSNKYKMSWANIEGEENIMVTIDEIYKEITT